MMKLLVLDGNSILNRAFYGIKLLTTKDGHFTNAIYGFLTMLKKMWDETQPDAVAIAFDRKEPTFRHLEYDGYKAQRKGMPEELAEQLPVLKELLELLGYPLVEQAGFEADDILGTLAKASREQGAECVIATGDRDSLQLVGDGVTVRLAATKFGQPQVTVYDAEKIREEYGVEPPQMIEIKALQGDSSDNIPGVAGIGPKGAGELIRSFHDIDHIYENLDTIDIKEGMRKKLREGKESAYLSRKLGTICTDVPIDTKLETYRLQSGDKAAAARLMARLELFSLIPKLGLDAAAQETPEQSKTADSLPVKVLADGAGLLIPLQEQGRADLTAVYDGNEISSLLLPMDGTVFVLKPEKAFLRALCGNAKIVKNIHNSKPFYAALERLGVEVKNFGMDTLLAAYLLNPTSSDYGVERLAAEYEVPVPSANGEYADAARAALLPALVDRLTTEIEQNGQLDLLKKIELPLAKVLAGMETVGFAVDAAGIEEYGKGLQTRIDEIQSRIYEQVGYEFNVNSPKQLGQALFEKLGLHTGKKTKSGYSTNAEVLESLRYDHPAVEMILEYRGLTKLKSTYCDGLLKVIGQDGRIHSSFNQTETRTGRISSTEPNLQNIPVRTEQGRELRRFFIARPGWVLVDADYSQIELRVLAHVADDKNMIEAFRENADIHRSTAAQVFRMPEEMVTPIMRSRAKAVNFGIVYGIGAFSLSKNIGVTRKEADDYIKAYLAHYDGVRSYMNHVVELAKERGYAETLFGRRRYLPELTSSNFNLRSFGERVAMNMPIQGTAADIIKIAMIRVAERLTREKMQAQLILQVHDELIVEAPQEEAEAAAKLLTEEMQNAVSLSVPMLAEAKIGKTWYDAKE
ncbi:DNA polymerase I [Faecalispora jeddahensis]|uniref:DNA polymerase I n=1 Tax=Faecalispora jeddahensis TaxID=1414721 RepID=UPI0027B9B458|nr:DNA polymerase I [Faecalispora jeddahensis]